MHATLCTVPPCITPQESESLSLQFRVYIQPKSEWQPPKGVPLSAHNLTTPIICHIPPSKCGHTHLDHLSNSSWNSIHLAPKYELSELSELSGWSPLSSAAKQQHSNQLCMAPCTPYPPAVPAWNIAMCLQRRGLTNTSQIHKGGQENTKHNLVNNTLQPLTIPSKTQESPRGVNITTC
eukprot:jgi/Chrzof1/6530/Cz19g00020.t1